MNLSFPDLTGVTGWDPGIELIADTFVDWWIAAESREPLDQLVRWVPTQEVTIFEEGLFGGGMPR